MGNQGWGASNEDITTQGLTKVETATHAASATVAEKLCPEFESQLYYFLRVGL